MPNPIDALRQLQPSQPHQPRRSLGEVAANPGPATGSLYSTAKEDLYPLLTQFKREAEDRLFREQRAGTRPAEVGALQGLLSRMDRDITETGVDAGVAEADAYRAQERDAILAGFGGGARQNEVNLGPVQAQNLYQKGLGEEKLRQPVELERIKQAGDLAQQQEMSRGNLAVADRSARGAIDTAREYSAISRTFGVADGRPVRSFNPKTGATTFEATPKGPNASILNNIAVARQALAAATASGDEDAVNATRTGYEQMVAAAFSMSQADIHLKKLAALAGSDPELQHLSTTELVRHPKVLDGFDGVETLTPLELQQLDQLLNYSRGL